MQSFIVTSDFKTNASLIDSKRAFKNVLENKQVLDVIVNKKKAWSNHPVTRMWRNHPMALFHYIESFWNECQSRGIAVHSNLYQECKNLVSKLDNQEIVLPDWITRDDIHSSHRSRLLSKGFIDALCVDVKQQLKVKSLDKWLKERYKKDKNQMRYDDGLKLQSDFPQVNFITPNFYEQYGWTDNIRANYVWPV